MTDSPSPIASALRRILRPLVRVLLRNNVPFGVFSEHARQIYVEVAAQQLGQPERAASDSRIAVVTGLTRKEVSRLRKSPDPTPPGVERYNRAARVIGVWIREADFRDEHGSPLPLPFDDGEITFSELVRRAGVDVPPRAVLDELLRVEAVVRADNGLLLLVTRAYVPRTGEEEKLGILGTDVADLIATIDHNLTHPPEAALFQRKVEYDNLVASALPELRRRARRRGQSVLEALNEFMAKHDVDTNADLDEDGGRRAVLGIYYYEEPTEDE